jgi:hypothetical protein
MLISNFIWIFPSHLFIIYIAIIYKTKSEIYVLSVRSIYPLVNIQFAQMAQSQHVSQYISDAESDDDMQLESSTNNGNVEKRRKQNRRKW